VVDQLRVLIDFHNMFSSRIFVLDRYYINYTQKLHICQGNSGKLL
jgi:hypothetical protein